MEQNSKQLCYGTAHDPMTAVVGRVGLHSGQREGMTWKQRADKRNKELIE